LRAIKVLLVDDENDFVRTLGKRLRFRGMEVSTAVSMVEAIPIIQEETYDVIILGPKMSETNGLETLKMLKEKNPNLHAILLTGHITAERGILAMMSGAEEIVEKPSNIETLIKKIEKVLSKKMVNV